MCLVQAINAHQKYVYVEGKGSRIQQYNICSLHLLQKPDPVRPIAGDVCLLTHRGLAHHQNLPDLSTLTEERMDVLY